MHITKLHIKYQYVLPLSYAVHTGTYYQHRKFNIHISRKVHYFSSLVFNVV